jgi:hypothetical protein
MNNWLRHPIASCKAALIAWAIEPIEATNEYRVLKAKAVAGKIYIECNTGEWRVLGRRA